MLKFYVTGNFLLSGRKDSEIINTLEYYKAKGVQVPMPDEKNQIANIEKFVVLHMLPMATLDQEFEYIEPIEDIGFQVHPNAIIHLMRQTINYEKLLRGKLYKIEPGRDFSRMPPLEQLKEPRIACYSFLPKDAMEALAHYDWDPLIGKYIDKAIQREKTLKHPNIGLNNTIKNNARQVRKDFIEIN